MSFSPRTFRCPNCNEMINDQMTECRYCSVPVDPGVAQLIADRQQKANQAVSDASFLRTATIAMWVFLGLSFIPFLPLVELGFVIVAIVVIVLAIRWQVKFNNLLTSDADYQAARKSWRTSLLLMLVALPVAFIVRPLLYIFVFGIR
jgi:Ca2+/Na+ antiporter